MTCILASVISETDLIEMLLFQADRNQSINQLISIIYVNMILADHVTWILASYWPDINM